MAEPSEHVRSDAESRETPVTVREFDARMAEVRRAVDLASAEAGSHVDLRDYVEALFEQKQRALDMASDEREKAASALRDEQRRAMETAGAEREKSAQALREGMGRSIQEGDDRLREHISNQIQQIEAALLSADKLEMERIDLVKTEVSNLDYKVAGLFEEKQKALDSALIAQKEAVAKAEIATDRIAARGQIDQEALRADMQERLAAVRRELEQATAAQKEAVLKAEAANQKVFDGQNEWRGQSADRERTSQEQMAKLTATYMPREVADTQFAELRKQLATNTDRLNSTTGAHKGASDFRTAAVGVLGLLLTLVLVIATVYVATHK